MYIALYKGKGNILDYLIRKRTKSDYSHVELVLDLDDRENMLCLSAKPNEGVRCDLISYNRWDWDLVRINESKVNTIGEIVDYYYATRGAGYDYLGVLSFVSKTKENPKKYFCSEWVGRALGFCDASKLTPYDLYNRVKYLNNI